MMCEGGPDSVGLLVSERPANRPRSTSIHLTDSAKCDRRPLVERSGLRASEDRMRVTRRNCVAYLARYDPPRTESQHGSSPFGGESSTATCGFKRAHR